MGLWGLNDIGMSRFWNVLGGVAKMDYTIIPERRGGRGGDDEVYTRRRLVLLLVIYPCFDSECFLQNNVFLFVC